MRRVRVIPVLLIQNGGLVKSIKFRNHKYVGDPINAVKIFNDKEVDEIIILDISATPNKRVPDINHISEIAGEAFMPFAYGGGITSVDQVTEILYQGAEKVVLNTSALENPSLIESVANRYGAQSVVVSIDVKNTLIGGQRVFRNGGSKKTSWHIEAFAKHVESLGAGEIMLTSIDQDGTFDGFDTKMINKVSSAVKVPVIACGGASSLVDLRAGIDAGASAVAAGSFFIYQMPHRAVLISYPSQSDLKTDIFDHLG